MPTPEFRRPGGGPVLLSAYAARSCPVKTQNAYDITLTPPVTEPDESLAELFDGGAAFQAQVLDALAAECQGRVVDLRTPASHLPRSRTEACREALRSGADVVLGGRLPVDLGGHRRGQPDILVRGVDQEDGTPRYHPVLVKWHKVVERRTHRRSAGDEVPDGPQSTDPSGRAIGRSLGYTTLDAPGPGGMQRLDGFGARLSSREGDFLQLAHYHRMLEAAGFATAEDARAAVIGTDDVLSQPLLAWVDLDEPQVRTFSRSDSQGWRWRSLLARYDHEHGFRVDVAVVAAAQTGHPQVDPALLVRPIVTTECGRCPWWEHCRPQLDPDDVSLRIDKGPLDVREIATLRSHGINTLIDLANADLDTLKASYLPQVTHRSGAETRLQLATRRAQMMLTGHFLERETSGPIAVPAAEVEIDFDIETSADGRIYLWGFLVNDPSAEQPHVYRAFSRFADLDAATELELAREALGWLQAQTRGGRSLLVYHYSGYEITALRTLADRQPDPLLEWAVGYASKYFVDLLELVKAHFFGVSGLGLKMVARQAAGFRWRDEDPGGLNSQRWFTDAVHAETPPLRAAARQRVLDYNEDDVAATERVRAWLRAS